MTNNTTTAGTESQEQDKLTQYFAAKNPGCEVWLTDFKRSASGFSNETRFFILNIRKDGRTGSRALAARWAPMGENRQFDAYDIAYQYHAMKALAKVGIPVPETVLLETDASVVGTTFFVMAKVEGEVISDYPPGAHGAGYLFEATEAMRRQIWWRSLEVMAKVNCVDWRKPEFGFMDIPKDGADSVRKRLAFMRKQAKIASDKPVELFERAFRWLDSHIPAAPKLALCWSDGRPGNIVWQNYEPAAACDWETAYIGPPENDLVWFLLVDEIAYKSHGQKRLAGLPSEAETIARYEQLIGRKMESLDYYFVMQATLLAILMALSVKAAIAKGIQMPADYATNNVATQRLQELLEQVA